VQVAGCADQVVRITVFRIAQDCRLQDCRLQVAGLQVARLQVEAVQIRLCRLWGSGF
jgi:hypothetical protein